MQTIITICAECMKVLGVVSDAAPKEAPVPPAPEEVIYSHGICYECGVKLYGRKIMANVGDKYSTMGRQL
jgi:phosphate/sulfate permease